MKNILFLLLTFLLIVPDVYGFEYRVGTSYERMDPELSAIRDLNSDENKLPYYTGSGTASLADLTPFARTILDDADAAAVRSTIGAEGELTDKASLYATLSDVSDFCQPGANETITGYWSNLVFRGTLATGALGSIATMDMFWTDPDNYDPASTGWSGAGNDYLALKTTTGYVPLLKSDGSAIHGAMQLPYSDSGDATLTEGYIQQKSDEDGIAVHMGSSGNIQTEALMSAITHVSIPFDPEAVGGYAVHVLPIGEIGDELPHGFKIYQWKFSFDSDPTAELAADDIYIKYADDFTTRANAVEVDDLGATSSGKSSETTAANINSGNAIPNGKFLYIDVADYSEAGHICVLELWGYAEED